MPDILSSSTEGTWVFCPRGECDTPLLIFYLLIDRSNERIIVDQPEEILNNQAAYRTPGWRWAGCGLEDKNKTGSSRLGDFSRHGTAAVRCGSR